MSQALDHNKVKVLAGNEAGVEIKFYLKPGAPSQPVFFQKFNKNARFIQATTTTTSANRMV
jgi:hypothetical protein